MARPDLRRTGLGAVLVLLAACRSAPPEVPAELRGTWATSDSRFVGRTMAFGVGDVVFEPGDGSRAWHAVTGVEPVERDEGRGWIVRYANEEGREHGLALSLSADGRVLRLEHRPDVAWTRRGGGP